VLSNIQNIGCGRKGKEYSRFLSTQSRFEAKAIEILDEHRLYGLNTDIVPRFKLQTHQPSINPVNGCDPWVINKLLSFQVVLA